MNKPATACAFDATLQQSESRENFPWSGFCKRGIFVEHASFQARANYKQWAHAAKKLRSGNSSRRIEWLNSLWPQRFWCPLSRQPAQRNHPNPCSISSRSRPRSTWSQCRPRASITDSWMGQGDRSASPLADRPNQGFMGTCKQIQHGPFSPKCLWPIRNASATVFTPRCIHADAEHRLAARSTPVLSTTSDNRSFQCRRPLSLLPSARPWSLLHAHVRPQNQHIRQCQRPFTWSRPAPKAKAVVFSGQTIASGPDTARTALGVGGQSC